MLAANFPIAGGDFVKQHGLKVDPANCRLANGQGRFFATMVLYHIPPTTLMVMGSHPQF
jgi:hypothetical protein